LVQYLLLSVSAAVWLPNWQNGRGANFLNLVEDNAKGSRTGKCQSLSALYQIRLSGMEAKAQVLSRQDDLRGRGEARRAR
jgi:hypothetical protein